VLSILAGALGLVALDAVVNAKGAANFGAVLGFASKVVGWFTDPNVPGIPDLSAAPGPITGPVPGAAPGAPPAYNTIAGEGTVTAQANAPPPPAYNTIAGEGTVSNQSPSTSPAVSAALA
jgi:hypothetical protein